MLDTDLGSQRSQNANKTTTMNSTAAYGIGRYAVYAHRPLCGVWGAAFAQVELETCTKTLATHSQGSREQARVD